MALETGTTLASLVAANPTSIDPVSQGDDHLRLIKDVLKKQFPGAAGQGYASVILATEAELNLLVGVTSLTPFPSGTKLPFYQTSPPAGWSAATVVNDSMMRVVNVATTGGVANAGGGQSPILNNTVPSHTHVFTGDLMATHAHNLPYGSSVVGASGGAVVTITGAAPPAVTATSAGTPTGTNAANVGNANWAPRYMDFCIGNKT